MLAGLSCSVGVRIALLYVQTSQRADSLAVEAASLSSAGFDGCASVLELIQKSGGTCSDDGLKVRVAIPERFELPWAEFEVFGQASIGYMKLGSQV